MRQFLRFTRPFGNCIEFQFSFSSGTGTGTAPRLQGCRLRSSKEREFASLLDEKEEREGQTDSLAARKGCKACSAAGWSALLLTGADIDQIF